MSRPLATISVDVDPIDLHLVGYGYRGLPPDHLIYERALPRLVEAFARAGMRATLFCVGRDAEREAPSLRALAAAGHEVASHTFTHPIRFASMPRAALRAELADSRAALTRACGVEVVGFRAPNFDFDAGVVPELAALGYLYDASAYPSLMLLPARVLLALKSRDRGAVLGMKPWPFTWSRMPYRWRVGDASIVEFPVAVTHDLRLPVYHTLRYYRSEASFLKSLDAFARRGESLCYVLHAVDVLGLVEDGVDPRLAPHPGMNQALDAKLALLESTLSAIAARFEIATYRERLDPLR